jgi:hypothetical protein
MAGPLKKKPTGRSPAESLIFRMLPISGTFIFGFGTAIIFVRSILEE